MKKQLLSSSLLRKTVQGLFLALGVWLIILGYLISSYPVTNPTEGADVIIVLGAAVINNQPSPVFQERLNHAIALFETGNARKLIFTGGYGSNAQGQKSSAESLVARHYAIRKGVRAGDVFIETRSHTTLQNLQEAQKVMAQQRLGSCIIVSDPLHMKRAMMMAEDLNLPAFGSATPTSRYKSLRTKIPFLLREMYFYHHYLILGD